MSFQRESKNTAAPWWFARLSVHTAHWNSVPHQNFAHSQNEYLTSLVIAKRSDKISAAMSSFLRHLVGWMISALGSRQDLILENLALRQQLLSMHAKRPRHRLSTRHKFFWLALQRLWPNWKTALIFVTPRTVVEWHRSGFRLYWKWLSRAQQVVGRKPVSQEVRTLIFRMAAENPTWGAAACSYLFQFTTRVMGGAIRSSSTRSRTRMRPLGAPLILGITTTRLRGHRYTHRHTMLN